MVFEAKMMVLLTNDGGKIVFFINFNDFNDFNITFSFSVSTVYFSNSNSKWLLFLKRQKVLCFCFITFYSYTK
jgi:hypothetical protein